MAIGICCSFMVDDNGIRLGIDILNENSLLADNEETDSAFSLEAES